MVAFLVKARKKKGNSGTKATKKTPDERMKEIYEAQAGEYFNRCGRKTKS